VRDVLKLVGTAGGVTTCDDNPGVGIDARDSTHGLARALIGAGRHRTGIDDHDVGVLRHISSGPGSEQLLLEPERIRLVHAAAKGDDGVLHLNSSVL
jgi:hypothetical protein